MFNIHKAELNWGGRTLVIETGKMARQADGSVVVTYGDLWENMPFPSWFMRM